MASQEPIVSAIWSKKDTRNEIPISEQIRHLGLMARCNVSILPATDGKTRDNGCRIKYDMFDIVPINMKHISLYDNACH